MNKKLLIGVIVILSVAIGTAFFLNTRKNNIPVLTQTTDQTASWKTYNDTEFGFSIQYPSRFISSPVPEDREFYITVKELSSKYNETIKISVISNVDIYEKQDVIKVATREVVDSGYKYTVSPIKVGEYSAAVTNMDVVTNKDNLRTQSTIITIQNPNKNLYVVLTLPRDISKVEFEEILTSFNFTDSSDQE